MKRIPYLLGATSLVLALTTVSCTTLGTHVKGGFACKAPQGTCAPMSNIDAQAIAGLGVGVGRAMPVGSNDRGEARFITTGGEGIPVRTGDRVMRVVFPAHTDGSGVYHEEAVAHVVSEHSGWALRPADPPGAGSLDAAIRVSAPSPGASASTDRPPGIATSTVPLNLREAAAGLAAPADPMPDAPRDQIAIDMPGRNDGAPTAAALAAAREGHRIGDAMPAPFEHARVRHLGGRRRHRPPTAVVAARPTSTTTAALNRAEAETLKTGPVSRAAPNGSAAPHLVAAVSPAPSAQPAGAHQ